MEELVRYRLDGRVARITMDDGRKNVMSPRMLAAIGSALDRAVADRAVVLLTGREGVFSAGFDLAVLREGGSEAIEMLRGGFELASRLLAFPSPVVIACNGHAIAMGVFLLLSGDYRIGSGAPCRITANEVAIGLTMPHPAVEILRQRLDPSAFTRAALLAEVFSPAEALRAGFFDRVVDAGELEDASLAVASSLAALDMGAHAASKLRARAKMLDAIRIGVETDFGALAPVTG